MYIKLETLKKILNLKSSSQIDEQIADRQTQVIYNAFNHLIQEKNKFIYIGDEVGLGKTYIALGVASLLRAYSAAPETHQDVILVPKKNLQFKWEKEIRNFNQTNYLIHDNVVKSVLGKQVGESVFHDGLKIFEDDHPAYHLYRHSSFSLSVNRRHWDTWIKQLREKLTSQTALDLFDVFKRDGLFEKGGDEGRMKRLYAYLLNICLPEIECLIVDEVHNYRHGIFSSSAARNQVTARFMGVLNEEQDKDILERYPRLGILVKSKVKKLILLSATPMDRHLVEIKNQLDCFLPRHCLENKFEAAEINKELNSFMIRGLMNVTIGDETYSRNQYRFEHRKGNVEKKEDAPPQQLDDDKQGLIMGLVQYATIKELAYKNNASFEIGMLAGFESFSKSNLSRHKKNKEFEEVSTKDNKAVDENVIKKIAESYSDKFSRHIPHPKMDNLIKQLFENYLLTQKKALVFVRRIASSSELEQRLLLEFETHIRKILTNGKFPYRSEPLDRLLRLFNEKNEEVKRNEVFYTLLEKDNFNWWDNEKINEYLLTFSEDDEIYGHIVEWLTYIYEKENFNPDFVEMTKKHFHRKKRYEKQFALLALAEMDGTLELWKKQVAEKDADKEQKDNSDKYFFNVYFSRGEGLRFRNKMYRQTWFDFNYLLFQQTFGLFELNGQDELKDDVSKKQSSLHADFVDFQDYFIEHVGNKLSENKTAEINLNKIKPKYIQQTFITELLLIHCRKEFEKWICSNKKKAKYQKIPFLNNLKALIEIIRSIFRNGSGLLPTYIADCSAGSNDFSRILSDLISNKKYFPFVLGEIKKIINDFDILMNVNFPKTNQIQSRLRWQTPVIGTSGQDTRDVRQIATQFRMPGFPYVLITTDILKEGEDLHTYCQDVFHYGIAWNPTDMEQRTGRIDRIGSLNARRMKQEKEINFNNKIQVFFPYLADTLEVNQVKKVFDGMDRFIRIFYSDLSRKILKDSKVSIRDRIIEIPSQNNNKLISIYEYDCFKSVWDKSKHLELRSCLGTSGKEVDGKLREIFNKLKNRFDFHVHPALDPGSYTIWGDIQLLQNKDRRGPFEIRIVNNKQLGIFDIQLLTYVCKSKHSSHKRERELLKEKLEKEKFVMSDNNDYIQATTNLPFDMEMNQLMNQLKKLVFYADCLELEYNDDAKVF